MKRMFRSEETKRAAVEMVLKGNPVRKVAESYGVSDAAVRKWVKSTPAALALPAAPVAAHQGDDGEGCDYAPKNLLRIYGALNVLKEAGLF